MKKNKRYGSQYLVAAGISLLLLTAVFQLSARTLPGFGTWYAHHIYPWIVGSVGRVTGLFPFSMVEMGLYGLILLLVLDAGWLFAASIHAFRRRTAAAALPGDPGAAGVATLPDLDKDATDRNRTSPFAFTGNKFEFRMVGSSDSVAPANVVLNTIVAEAFKEAADELEKADDFDTAVHDMIKKLLRDHKHIIFNGNGYSDAWVEEAERRGLPNIRSMVDAIPALTTEKAVKLYESFGVFTRAELESRAEVEYEAYGKMINIEARTMIDMASKQIIPAVIKYTTQLAGSLGAVKAACPEADTSVQAELLTETSALLSDMKVALAALIDITEEAACVDGVETQARVYHEKVVPAMAALRTPADKLEMIVDKDLWPFPSYGDLIFEV